MTCLFRSEGQSAEVLYRCILVGVGLTISLDLGILVQIVNNSTIWLRLPTEIIGIVSNATLTRQISKRRSSCCD